MDGNPLERLEKDVFKAAGLVNLQVIQMRNCHLIDVHEHAFRGLVILKEVDIRYVDIFYYFLFLSRPFGFFFLNLFYAFLP
jgi:hypothetical protein